MCVGLSGFVECGTAPAVSTSYDSGVWKLWRIFLCNVLLVALAVTEELRHVSLLAVAMCLRFRSQLAAPHQGDQGQDGRMYWVSAASLYYTGAAMHKQNYVLAASCVSASRQVLCCCGAGTLGCGRSWRQLVLWHRMWRCRYSS